jgi:hypothetical protein
MHVTSRADRQEGIASCCARAGACREQRHRSRRPLCRPHGHVLLDPQGVCAARVRARALAAQDRRRRVRQRAAGGAGEHPYACVRVWLFVYRRARARRHVATSRAMPYSILHVASHRAARLALLHSRGISAHPTHSARSCRTCSRCPPLQAATASARTSARWSAGGASTTTRRTAGTKARTRVTRRAASTCRTASAAATRSHSMSCRHAFEGWFDLLSLDDAGELPAKLRHFCRVK